VRIGLHSVQRELSSVELSIEGHSPSEGFQRECGCNMGKKYHASLKAKLEYI